jgi:RNA polymerase sigma-70 factor, ECF subfamily
LMTPEEISCLYKKFGPLIYRRCLRFLGDSEQAADAAQEVFVRAMRHRKKLENDREGLPWLYKVTTNYCLNCIREKDSVFAALLPENNQTLSTNQTEGRVLIRDLLSKWLSRFDAVTSQIALHFHLDGMTQDEIAACMGLSRRTVGKKLKQFRSAAQQTAAKGELL